MKVNKLFTTILSLIVILLCKIGYANHILENSYINSESNYTTIGINVITSDVSFLGGNDGQISVSISGGLPPYDLIWSTGETTLLIDSLFAGTYSLTVTDSSGSSIMSTYNIESPIPAGWEVDITPSIHEFYLATDSLVILSNSVLSNGSLIGVFHFDNGQYYCAGYTFWNQTETYFNAYVDSANSGVGAPIYEEIIYKVYDVSINQEYFMEPYINWAYPSSCTQYYCCTPGMVDCQLFGLQEISGLNDYTFIFPAGWSMFGFPLDPYESSFDSLFTSIMNQIKVIKDDKANVFWPDYNVNTIGNIDYREGYQINMLSAQSLTVYGSPVYPSVTAINISQGWNMFSYFSVSSIDVQFLFGIWTPCFELLKDENGYIYWPVFYLTYPYTLSLGNAYSVYFNCPYTFYLPAN